VLLYTREKGNVEEELRKKMLYKSFKQGALISMVIYAICLIDGCCGYEVFLFDISAYIHWPINYAFHNQLLSMMTLGILAWVWPIITCTFMCFVVNSMIFVTQKVLAVAAQKPVNADFPVKSTGNEENHEVQEGTGKK
jgi:hypothetical protein